MRETQNEEKVSLGLAARLCETPLALFMDFAAKHGVPPLRYTFEDLDEERKAVERLGRLEPLRHHCMGAI